MAIVAIYGAAQAFFDPASDAIMPELLPSSQLGAANALEQMVRPLALRMAGPAVGGVLVGVLGPGRGVPGGWRDVLGVGDCTGDDVHARVARTRGDGPDGPGARHGRRGRPGSRHGRPRGGERQPRAARGLWLRAPARVAVGDVRQRGHRLPAVHGPRAGAAAVHGQARAGRQRRAARPSARGGRPGLGGVRAGDDAQRAAAARA